MKKLIAEYLLEIEAVFLSPNEPFTWASGIKSPIYCDNRLTLSYPKVRQAIAQGLSDIVKAEFPECEVIMGAATGGIAHGAYVADILDLPMGYVRSGSKSHGRSNQIEGKLESGQKVVVIEDLFSTGGSTLDVVSALREDGAEVLGAVSIFTYGMNKAKENFEKAECQYTSLTNYDVLLEVALEKNYISSEDLNKLKIWKQNPSDESWLTK